jgi:hypothetical protein
LEISWGRVCTPYHLHVVGAQIVKWLGPSEMASQEIDSSVPILLFGNWALRMSPRFKGALLVGSWCQKVPRAAEKRDFVDCPSEHYSSFLFYEEKQTYQSCAGEFAVGMSGVHRFLQNSMSDRSQCSVVARSKAWVCGRTLAGIVGSNPTVGMDVCLSCDCWVLGRGLRVVLVARPEES